MVTLEKERRKDMEMVRANSESMSVMILDAGCPYSGNKVCMASLSSLVIDGNTRASCCSTDNYDDCPIFLSKMLRGRGRV
jgi:hypothetical protein